MPRASANDKNSACTATYLKIIKKVSCKEDLENIFKSGYSMAKVIKNLGSCRLEVVEQNGNQADVRISPSVVQLIKRESNVNEIVLIDGGFIKAKIPAHVVLDILTIFEKCSYELPKIFFAVSSATEEDDMFDHAAVAEEEPVAELDVDKI